MIKSTLFFTLALVLVCAAATAFADECGQSPEGKAHKHGKLQGPGAPGGPTGDMMLKHLERVQPPLTDAQKEQVKKLAEETRAKMAAATTPEERRDLAMTMRKTVMETILTDEQRGSLPRMGQGQGKGAGAGMGMGMGKGRGKGPKPPAEGTQPPPPPPAE
jgi:Spy/CpxP family protein refolding chaperone